MSVKSATVKSATATAVPPADRTSTALHLHSSWRSFAGTQGGLVLGHLLAAAESATGQSARTATAHFLAVAPAGSASTTAQIDRRGAGSCSVRTELRTSDGITAAADGTGGSPRLRRRARRHRPDGARCVGTAGRLRAVQPTPGLPAGRRPSTARRRTAAPADRLGPFAGRRPAADRDGRAVGLLPAVAVRHPDLAVVIAHRRADRSSIGNPADRRQLVAARPVNPVARRRSRP